MKMKTISKSWGMTIAVYGFAFLMLFVEAQYDFEISEAQVSIISMMLGSTTAGGVFVASWKYKEKIKAKIKGVDDID